jgi:hypothetical protein
MPIAAILNGEFRGEQTVLTKSLLVAALLAYPPLATAGDKPIKPVEPRKRTSVAWDEDTGAIVLKRAKGEYTFNPVNSATGLAVIAAAFVGGTNINAWVEDFAGEYVGRNQKVIRTTVFLSGLGTVLGAFGWAKNAAYIKPTKEDVIRRAKSSRMYGDLQKRLGKREAEDLLLALYSGWPIERVANEFFAKLPKLRDLMLRFASEERTDIDQIVAAKYRNAKKRRKFVDAYTAERVFLRLAAEEQSDEVKEGIKEYLDEQRTILVKALKADELPPPAVPAGPAAMSAKTKPPTPTH